MTVAFILTYKALGGEELPQLYITSTTWFKLSLLFEKNTTQKACSISHPKNLKVVKGNFYPNSLFVPEQKGWNPKKIIPPKKE